jgi:hypothetical protein
MRRQASVKGILLSCEVIAGKGASVARRLSGTVQEEAMAARKTLKSRGAIIAADSTSALYRLETQFRGQPAKKTENKRV